MDQTTEHRPTLLAGLLDLVFPWVCPLCRRPGAAPAGLCPGCLAAIAPHPSWRCPRCGLSIAARKNACCPPGDGDLDGLLAVTDYRAAARDAVHRLKYSASAPAGRAMGELLADAARRLLETRPGAVVPVPLAPRRLGERGFNQAGLLARRVARELGVPVSWNLLVRARETSRQARLGAGDRRRNIAGAFIPGNRREPAPSLVLLVDDVSTTGSTLASCARVLRRMGASSVVGAVFACAPREDSSPARQNLLL